MFTVENRYNFVEANIGCGSIVIHDNAYVTTFQRIITLNIKLVFSWSRWAVQSVAMPCFIQVIQCVLGDLALQRLVQNKDFNVGKMGVRRFKSIITEEDSEAKNDSCVLQINLEPRKCLRLSFEILFLVRITLDSFVYQQLCPLARRSTCSYF